MNLKRLIQEEVKKYLNEELLGNYVGEWYKKPFEVYKNPPSIKRMNSDIRGFVDSEGNLYLANADVDSFEASTDHKEIFDFLRKKGIGKRVTMYFDKNEKRVIEGNLVPVQRLRDTNDFYLGEGFSYTGLKIEQVDEIVDNAFKNAKIKNPRINFTPYSINSALHDLKNKDYDKWYNV